MFDDRFARIQRDLKVLKWMSVATMVLVYILLFHAVMFCE